MDELLQQLRDARKHASAGQMEEATEHIDEALELLDEALAHRPGPKASVRAVRDCLSEACFAATRADSFGTVAALDLALRVLEPKSKLEA